MSLKNEKYGENWFRLTNPELSRYAPYKVGTIKLTWVDPDDNHFLNGKMLDTVDEAIAEAESRDIGNNWLIFELIQTDAQRYEWKVLPYGNYKGYVYGMKVQDSIVIKVILGILIMYGAYSLSRKILFRK